MKRTIFVGVGTLALVASVVSLSAAYNQVAGEWTCVPRQETSKMIGAWGLYQYCGVSTPCLPDCVCNDTECVQHYGDHGWYCAQTTGCNDHSGPTGDGTFLDCAWSEGWWCGESDTDRCGVWESCNCPIWGFYFCLNSYGICQVTSDAGAYDCE